MGQFCLFQRSNPMEQQYPFILAPFLKSLSIDVEMHYDSDWTVKRDYRHSLTLHVVYYRQSWQEYLVKNCADNRTGPITRRSHVE